MIARFHARLSYMAASGLYVKIVCKLKYDINVHIHVYKFENLNFLNY